MENQESKASESKASESGVSAQMPRYKCHKIVHALKILAVKEIEGSENETVLGARLVVEPPFAAIEVGAGYCAKHKPVAGGYYVVYEDGYKSFSPAEAFESGYTLMEN